MVRGCVLKLLLVHSMWVGQNNERLVIPEVLGQCEFQNRQIMSSLHKPRYTESKQFDMTVSL